MSTRQLRVAMIGAFDPDYARHQIIRVGLERVGIRVTSLVLARKSKTLTRVIELYRRWREIRHCDVILIPAFNEQLAPFIWLLGHLLRKPMLLDYMVGLTDSLVHEREVVPFIKSWIYRLIDNFNIERFISITDTAEHIKKFQKLASTKKMSVIPVGVYDEWFNPQPMPDETDTILVQFFGSYIPFHGVKIILDAAKRLQEETTIQFELIGRGVTYVDCRAYAEQLSLKNVQFIDPIKPDALSTRIVQAAICLGVFGAREKTLYVVPNKVYECMAMARPVITAESSAINEFFTPGKHLICVRPGDPDELAAAIRKLAHSPNERTELACAASERIQEAFLPEHIGIQVRALIESRLLGGSS